jgi:hypothetical protein
VLSLASEHIFRPAGVRYRSTNSGPTPRMRVVRGFSSRQVVGTWEKSDRTQETGKVAARHSVGTTFAAPREQASNPNSRTLLATSSD